MIRMSYSLLDRWLRGDKEGAVATYLRTPVKMTPAMKDGIEFDKSVKECIRTLKDIPQLKDVVYPLDTMPDVKLMNSFPGFDLSGELDAYSKEKGIIFEFKCSRIYDSGDYADSYQLPTYFLLCKKNNLPVEKGIVYRYNPVQKTFDLSILYYSERKVMEMESLYKKVAPEIEAYFKEEGVL